MSGPLHVPGLPERYRVEGPLGRGGQAETLAATDTKTDAQVVVKVFRLAGSDVWKRFELFERECAVLRSLEHPSIPRYVEHGGDEQRGTFWLVMQRAPGESLQAMIDRGKRFTDAQLQAIMNGLLEVLGYLHALNPPVIHRDLKPGNVVLDGERVWLVDFGSVRDAVIDSRQSTVVGTYGYMAPEQLRGQSSPASDLYGLGATLAAAATGTDAGKLPSKGLEVDLSEVIKPGPLRERLAWLLQADPSKRPSSVQAFRAGRDARAPGAADRERAVAKREVSAPARRSKTRRRTRAAVIAGSAVAIGAMVVTAGPVGAFVLSVLGIIIALGSLQFLRGLMRGLNGPDED